MPFFLFSPRVFACRIASNSPFWSLKKSNNRERICAKNLRPIYSINAFEHFHFQWKYKNQMWNEPMTHTRSTSAMQSLLRAYSKIESPVTVCVAHIEVKVFNFIQLQLGSSWSLTSSVICCYNRIANSLITNTLNTCAIVPLLPISNV